MAGSTHNRRNLLFLGAGLAAVATGWQLWLGRTKPLVFEPIAGLPTWRRIAFEGVTGTSGNSTNAVFVGIGDTEILDPLTADELCGELYASKGNGIPVAVFTDVNCPNCASLEAKLKARKHQLSINWHDLPLLGQSSERAARAMAAGDLQDNGAAFREAVLRTSPGRLMPANLQIMATQTGLDGARLLADMNGPVVEARLRRTRQAASTLGVWGTPGFTIGRTFVLGDMRAKVLDLLIEQQATQPAAAC